MFAFGIGLIVGLMYLFTKVYELFTNKYFNTKKWFIVLGIAGIALLTAQIVPPKEWDLFRHFEEIDRMRLYGSEYVWNSSRYRGYVSATLLFYIASLTPWNATLVFLTIFIELLIIEDILKFYRKKGMSAQTGSICFFLFLSLSNIVLAISGIRNVLAVILLNYSIWNMHCRKKAKVFNLILIFVAITVHPASGFLLILYFVSYIPFVIIRCMVAISILPILMEYSNKVVNSSNKLLASSAKLFDLYASEKAGLDMRVTVVSAILVITSIFIIFIKIKFMNDKSRYTSYALIYSLGTLGMITQGLIYSRMLYGLGTIYVVLLATGDEYAIKGKKYKKLFWAYKTICLIYFCGMLLFQGYELMWAILK